MEPVYFNNAATSWPKAPQVGETVAACINGLPHHAGRAGFSGPDVPGKCRSLLADLLQVKFSERIVFCPNATHALNIALQGFGWRKGGAIVTSVAEHNSVLRPLYYLAKTRRLSVYKVPVDKEGRIIPAEWQAAIGKYKPQLAVFTHASNVTGAINDAALLAGMAKAAGAATLLDASQTLGLVPVLPEHWGIDLLAFTGHKYLLGPTGTGGLYIAPGTELNPVWVGGTGIQSDLDEMPALLPVRFEAGTPNDAAFAGLAAALAWSGENPLDNVDGMQGKIDRLAAGLTALGADIIDVRSPRTPVISCTLKHWTVEDAGEALHKSFGIICRAGLHCAPQIHSFLGMAPRGTIRFSLSRFTTDTEVDYCLEAIGMMLHEPF
ncbi:aminotransferase class V-fold PLP-dependent enzyme [Sporomusa aerivorans]|uniref:aminotransferase class V-fold PLP-dependent enzyme n=1 Tax=Sporomusa aerivorans TaxID=204936 RepID=UPI00352AF8A0